MPTDFDHEVFAWRRARLSRLTAEDSWLSLIGRFPLSDGVHLAGAADGCSVSLPSERAPGHVGTFTVTGRNVTFVAAAPLRLRTGHDERELAPALPVALASDRNGTPDKLVLGSVTMEVMERDAGVFIRVRDLQSPARTHFPGLDYFPIEAKWRVVAKLVPYEPRKEIPLAYESGSTERYFSPGAAVFDVDGVQYRLDPVLDGDRPRLYVVFWDETARDETYGAGRFLYAPLPQGDRVRLDFNQAFNPPCAFTPYALCPLPPPQNRLPVRVCAGEKRPREYPARP